ncbi:MAG: galactosyldiacylglycerol synthase [Vicinamibacteria bacterium]|nr:galactosyldiacylglycerol synthase [Vicinamibacteria bacterium]
MIDARVQEILLFYHDAGGGHRNATRALTAAADKTKRPWRFRVVNIERELSSLDWLRLLSGVTIEDFYNLIVRRQLDGAFVVILLRLMHAVIRLQRRRILRTLVDFLRAQSTAPAAVVSVIHSFNGILREACREALPGVPFIVVMTDLADFPPRFWIEPGLERVIVGSDEAVEQALAAGLSPRAVTRVSGMILHPRYYETSAVERRAFLRREHGWGDRDEVILLLFGGKGAREMLPLARGLLAESPRWHVTAICGDNPPLVEALSRLATDHAPRLTVLGFTDRVADYMAASDLLVTKPGPGSLSEAWHQRLPVIVADNRKTLPQERFNARFLERRGLGFTVRKWRDVPRIATEYFADSTRRERIRDNLARLPRNLAVFEILDVIERDLQAPGSSAGCREEATPMADVAVKS